MEERINALTHGVGTALSVVGLITLAVAAYHYHSVWHQMSVFIYGGSLVLLYVAMLVFAMASGGIGLMVSSLSATQQQAFLGAFTVGVPCILISGAVTPVINMPPFLQYASQLNPMRHFTAIVQGVFLKDITVAAAAVNLGKIACISMVAVGVAVWMFKRKA